MGYYEETMYFDHYEDKMYFCDPSMCSYCQNHGFFDKLVNGKCHRCITRMIHDAAVTAEIRENARAFREIRKLLTATPVR